MSGATDVMQLLIDGGAQIDATPDKIPTALMCTAFLNQAQVAKILIDNRADIEQKDDDGVGVLMVAAAANAVDVM